MTRRASLADPIELILRLEGVATAREIARLLTASGFGRIDKGDVNRCLYAYPGRFRKTEAMPPEWSLADAGTRGTDPRPPKPSDPPVSDWLANLNLYPWQRRALDGWAGGGHRGVIEAVTGAGKTRLALAAIGAEIARGGRAAAVVPTTDLQSQWYAEINRHLIRGAGLRAQVGMLGDGSSDTLANADILVATVQSACRWDLYPPATGALLIADEVHHYGAEVWSRALEDGFDRRLGLTATYERDDDGVATILDPYFGPYRYSLGYHEALRDDVIAHFKIAFVGVGFRPGEAAEYAELDEKARKRRSLLVNQYGLAPEPFGVFMRQVVQLAKSGDEGAKQAGLYLHAFSKRRQLLASVAAKYDKLAGLAPAVAAADRTIVFTQTVEAANRAIARLDGTGLAGGVIHALLEKEDRSNAFDAFRDGDLQLIAAPKLLDEGVDVPDADLALVLASSRSRRQMIQRMGRVIRKKPDGRLARLAILYVEGTSEDPTQGAHEDFVQFVINAADETRVFAADVRVSNVVAYLSDWH